MRLRELLTSVATLSVFTCTPFKNLPPDASSDARPDSGVDRPLTTDSVADAVDAPSDAPLADTATVDTQSGSGGTGDGGGSAGTSGGRGGNGSGGLGGGAGGGAQGTVVGGGNGQTCSALQHNCAGTCVDNNSVAHCGTLCDPCAAAPARGTATCDGIKCDFTCGSLKKCTAKCTSGCCVDSDCPTQAGMAGQCDTPTNTCNYACAAGFKPCGVGTCIPMANCCVPSDCPGTCKTCSTAGSCVAVLNADDTDSCPGTCDATGACKSKRGQTCQTGAGCISGTTCAPDGYCCNTACTNSCEACDIAGFIGTCTPVASGNPHGNRVACAGAGTTCGGSCANRADGSCAYPTSACGGPQSCTNSSKSATTACNGGGQCPAPVLTACPNGCNAAGTDCLTCGAGLAACNGVCCLGGQSCCGGACVDTASNAQHCGNCGPACPTPPRSVAICAGGACGTTCVADAPKCTDGSCSRLSWSFDSPDLDGIVPGSPANLTMAVRTFGGNPALAVETPQLTQISFKVPICLSGSTDLRTRTFSMLVFFEGTPTPPGDPVEQFFLQVSVPGPQPGAFLSTQSVGSGMWVRYSAPLSLSTFSGGTTALTIQAGSFGLQFSGTIWFDDIKIE